MPGCSGPASSELWLGLAPSALAGSVRAPVPRSLQEATWGLGCELTSGRFVGRGGSGGVQGELVWLSSLSLQPCSLFWKVLYEQTPCPERDA